MLTHELMRFAFGNPTQLAYKGNSFSLQQIIRFRLGQLHNDFPILMQLQVATIEFHDCNPLCPWKKGTLGCNGGLLPG